MKLMNLVNAVPRCFGISALLLGGMLNEALLAQTSQPAQSEAESIRKEMQQMRNDYEERMQNLERRLQQLDPRPAATNIPAPAATAVGTNQEPTLSELYHAYANYQFRQDTETRDWALLQEKNRPVKQRMEQVLNNYVDIGGYFRAGYGRDDKGGPQPAFQAPGAFAKYRLGNEAENYGEIVFGKNWYAPELFALDPAVRLDGTPSGPIARTQFRVAFFDPYDSSGSSGGFQTSLPEAWAEIGNIFESQPSLKFWGGNRFYRRQDIHINDFFFYNMSGAGGGFEDLDLPFGHLALAWIGNGQKSGVYASDVVAQPDPNNLAGFSKQNFDLRLYDVAVPWGKGEFGLVGAFQNSGQDVLGQQAPDSAGVAVTFLHKHEHFLSDDGVNRFSIQYGTGAAKTFTSGFETATFTNGTFIVPDQRDSWRFRVTEDFIAQPWDHFSISPVVVYQYTDYRDAQGIRQWFSAGARPVYHFNKHLSLAFEGGADYVTDSALNRCGTLYKLTLAPQVSLGNKFFSRPVIRAFVTYAHWSDSLQGAVGGNDYVNNTHGWTWGIQMESWW